MCVAAIGRQDQKDMRFRGSFQVERFQDSTHTDIVNGTGIDKHS